MPQDPPLLKRFLAKLAHDVLPAALASVIGGLLYGHFEAAHSVASEQNREQAAPASAEMMRLVRDEHALIIDYLKAQMAAEKQRLADEDAMPRVAADARTDVKPATKPVAAAPAAHHAALAMAMSRSASAHRRAVSPPPPLVIAEAQPNQIAEAPARDPDSFLAKTIDLKDHVVSATQKAVAAIGAIPSWIAAVGDRIGGPVAGPPTTGRLVSQM